MKHLLIIRFSALGDVAMLVPIIQQLAITYPDVQITMLSRQHVKPLFIAMPNNVHFYGADLHGKHHGVRGLMQLLHDINYQQFDAVADMHNVLRSKWLTFIMRCRGTRIATLRKGRLEKWILTHINHKKQLPSTITRYCKVLERIDMPITMSNAIAITNSHKEGYGIAPFAAHKGKTYPLDKMEIVVKELAKTGEPIYLFGAGEREKQILESWANKYNNVNSLVGKYTMDEEIKLMQQLRLMLTMDSANMHLASIAGTRVISIWGATHPNAGFLGWRQDSNDCIQRNDLHCRPCSIYGNKTCKWRDHRCLDIDPYKIVQKLITTYGDTH